MQWELAQLDKHVTVNTTVKRIEGSIPVRGNFSC